MTNEVENLLSLIFQDGRTVVKDGGLLVPPEIAQRFGDQIRRLKPEILLALGHCPVCGQELTVKVEELPFGNPRGPEENAITRRTGIHTFCFNLQHHDSWKF